MAENRLNYDKTKITYYSCNSLFGLVAFVCCFKDWNFASNLYEGL